MLTITTTRLNNFLPVL